MTTTKTKYSVGDKVRILNVDGISGGKNNGYKNGDEAVLVGSFDDLAIPCKRFPDIHPLPLLDSELAYIEKADAKPTKKQRISALESQVADLQAQVARLQGVERVLKNVELTVTSEVDIDKISEQLAKVFEREAALVSTVTKNAEALRKLAEHKPQPTPNELRKAIIAEARAFVAKVEAQLNSALADRTQGNYTYQDRSGYAKYNVNAEKRTVVALVYDKYSDKLNEKAIAKCAPGDVFNADIGKAIALGRALGLDVSKFEQAVQPTEVVVGHLVKGSIDPHIYRAVSDFEEDDEVLSVEFCRYRKLTIIDDTEAQYE